MKFGLFQPDLSLSAKAEDKGNLPDIRFLNAYG
jgi:hypothetical protein